MKHIIVNPVVIKNNYYLKLIIMYKCIMTFTAMSGTTYYAGETISYSEYNFLNLKDRGNFRQEEDVIDTIIDTALDVGLGIMIGSMLSGGNDDSSPSSTSNDDSFGGFGGGDFGGGGASGDF